MVKKILTTAVILVILAQILSIAPAEENAFSPSESTVVEAYKAYYEILKVAIDEHGVVKKMPGSENIEYPDEWELSYAELIDFGNDGSPSLLYVTCFGYHRDCYIYGYSEGKAELYLTMFSGNEKHFTVGERRGGNNFHGFDIAADKNDVEYLRVFMYWKELEDEYYTVKNGGWITALARGYSLHVDGEVDWYINHNLVDAVVYHNAPETELGIVGTRNIPDNPDAVYAVLAELAEKAGAEMDVE